MAKLPYNKTELECLCKESDSYNEVLVKTGRTRCTNNRNVLKKYIALFNIDISHFSNSTNPTKYNVKINYNDEGLKQCIQCKQYKDKEKDYYWSNGHTRNICKKCVKENEKKKYQKRREQFIEYKKSLKCKKCGEERYYLLDFHHRDPKEKDFVISDRTRSNFKNLKEEIEKCDVLCSNCHREWHYLFSHKLIEDYEDWLNEK